MDSQNLHVVRQPPLEQRLLQHRHTRKGTQLGASTHSPGPQIFVVYRQFRWWNWNNDRPWSRGWCKSRNNCLFLFLRTCSPKCGLARLKARQGLFAGCTEGRRRRPIIFVFVQLETAKDCIETCNCTSGRRQCHILFRIFIISREPFTSGSSRVNPSGNGQDASSGPQPLSPWLLGFIWCRKRFVIIQKWSYQFSQEWST